MKVIPRERTMSSSRTPSAAISRLTRTMRAPTVSGKMTSDTAMSKESVVIARTTSFDVMPGVFATLASKFAAERCGTSTPFGLPVEPDV
jgi:beta-xylosidase